MRGTFHHGGKVGRPFSDWSREWTAQTIDVAVVSCPAARKVII